MEQKNQDMTSGSLAKGILFFSIPLMLSNILQVLFNMSDIAVVGHFAGAMALGSVGSTTILVTMFTGFLIGLSGGINVLVALYYGAKNERGVKETVHSAAILSLIIGVILLLIGAGFSRNILELLNTKEELLDGAVLYIRLYFLGLPALALYNFGNAVFSAVGDTKRPLLYLAVAGVLNILLNLFFVVVCQMGAAGVGLASACPVCVRRTDRARPVYQSGYFPPADEGHEADEGQSKGHCPDRYSGWLPEYDLCHREPVRPGGCQFLQRYYGGR